MNKLTRIFEGQTVKVTTDKGVTLINLIHTAKCCGLVRKGNTGLIKIRWDDIKKKLHLIINNLKVESSTPNIKQEIDRTLDEIENTDDRNSIYMSSWLSKRLAIECHSERAMKYKNFLVTMDEEREIGESVAVNPINNETVLELAKYMQGIGTVVQGMQTAMINIETYVKDSIQSKDLQIEQTMKLIGLRAVNTKRASDKLKEMLSEREGMYINANNPKYVQAKKKIFKQFKVVKWEDIPVQQYNAVDAYIEEL